MKGFEWKGSGPIRKGSILLATGFGLGLSPFASGTVGTVLGVALVVGLGLESLISQIALAVLCVILAVPICDVAEKHFGTKDDGRVVADEYLTFPLCVIGLPWQGAPYLLVMAFLTHRVLDIIKPPPANGLQRIHGGVGITIDDVISSLYALALNHAIYWWGIAPLLAK
jgi:phosphatidylglycerophosphatase A